MNTDLKKLANFLVKAKKQTYAGEGKEVDPQRPGFKELEYSDGDYVYRDSYIGFFSAPGQEIVRFKGVAIWSMAYSGGMRQEYHNNTEFAEKVFTFLKKVLFRVTEDMPFRGPKNFKEGDFEYINEFEGDITSFKGHEKILLKGKEVFSQDYIGGLIVHEAIE
jgi:hypothetical protein